MNNEYINELKGYPLLTKLKSENPFKVPYYFFENIEYPFLMNDSVEKNVPEGYFDRLPSEVISKLDIPKKMLGLFCKISSLIS